MRMRFSMEKALMNRESSPILVNMFFPVSPAYVGDISQVVVQILRIDVTLMGYWITGQVRTIMRSVMCKRNLRIGENILMRVKMIPCTVFLRAHLMSVKRIAMIGSGRGIFYCLGDAL